MPDIAPELDELRLLALALDLVRQTGTRETRFRVDRMIQAESTMVALRARLEAMVDAAGTAEAVTPYSQALTAYRLAEAVRTELDAFLLRRVEDECRRLGLTVSMVQGCLDAQQRAASEAALLRVHDRLADASAVPN